MKKDIYQKVTDKIIADLEQGELTWLKPWSAANTDGRIIKPLRHNGLPYSGINILMLWGAAMEGGYASPYWMTFKQAKEYDAHVKKGERGNLVVYANTITKTEETSNESKEERKIPFMKGYSVFNMDQIEGLPDHYYAEPPKVIDPVLRIDHADSFFAKTRADVRHGGNLTASFGHAEVPKSLRTRETAEVKERFATEYAAIQRNWAALRAKPEALPLKQIVSLAGRVYQRLTATLEDEPGESPIWENLGRLNKREAGNESRLEGW